MALYSFKYLKQCYSVQLAASKVAFTKGGFSDRSTKCQQTHGLCPVKAPVCEGLSLRGAGEENSPPVTASGWQVRGMFETRTPLPFRLFPKGHQCFWVAVFCFFTLLSLSLSHIFQSLSLLLFFSVLLLFIGALVPFIKKRTKTERWQGTNKGTNGKKLLAP